jgi:hypothetical protein
MSSSIALDIVIAHITEILYQFARYQAISRRYGICSVLTLIKHALSVEDAQGSITCRETTGS